MRLGLSLGYQTAWSTPADHLALAQEADRLGYSVVWAAEAYGSDSPSMLAWMAGQTERIDVGSAVMQIPARTPAMTAMTAATIDALSGGRFRLGLGVSGPQVSEGWHGVRFAKPLARTREYVDIVKLAVARKEVAYDGEHYTLPLPDGPGKALQAGLPPDRASRSRSTWPRSARRTWNWPARSPTAGWPSSTPRSSPRSSSPRCAAGRAKAGKELAGFDVVPSVPVVVGDDVGLPAPSWSAGTPRSTSAAWAAGSRTSTTSSPPGWATATPPARCRTSTWPGSSGTRPRRCRWSSSTAPRLLGPKERIAERMREYAAAGVTTLSVTLFVADRDSGVQTLRTVAEALDLSGVGE